MQDVEALSRDPKRIKTVHVLGHCQRMCQERGKLKGTSDVAFFVSTFVRALKSRGWGTGNKPLPTNWPGSQKSYSELSTSLGQVTILQMGVRQGVSSDSDEEVGSSSQSTVTQTNTDKDEMEEVVDEKKTMEDVGEGEGEGEGEEEEEEEKETEETEEEPDSVRELLSTHSAWLRM